MSPLRELGQGTTCNLFKESFLEEFCGRFKIMADTLFDLDAEVSDSDGDDCREVQRQERLELFQGAGFIVASNEDEPGESPGQSPSCRRGRVRARRLPGLPQGV